MKKSLDRNMGTVDNVGACIKRTAIVIASAILLLCPSLLRAQTPSVDEILAQSKKAWDGLKTYDATFTSHYPRSAENQTSTCREAWSKTKGTGLYYLFQDLNPKEVPIPYLRLRNSSGTWEVESNRVSTRAFNVLYATNVFRLCFEMDTNGVVFLPDVGTAEMAGVPCWTIVAEYTNGAPPFAGLLYGSNQRINTKYYIGTNDYLVRATVALDPSGIVYNRTIIQSLKVNGPLDERVFSVPAGIPKIVVTNYDQRSAYSMETLRALEKLKKVKKP